MSSIEEAIAEWERVSRPILQNDQLRLDNEILGCQIHFHFSSTEEEERFRRAGALLSVTAQRKGFDYLLLDAVIAEPNKMIIEDLAAAQMVIEKVRADANLSTSDILTPAPSPASMADHASASVDRTWMGRSDVRSKYKSQLSQRQYAALFSRLGEYEKKPGSRSQTFKPDDGTSSYKRWPAEIIDRFADEILRKRTD